MDKITRLNFINHETHLRNHLVQRKKILHRERELSRKINYWFSISGMLLVSGIILLLLLNGINSPSEIALLERHSMPNPIFQIKIFIAINIFMLILSCVLGISYYLKQYS